MKTPDNYTKVFLISRLPKDSYCDVDEFAQDLANALGIDADKIQTNLIASNDIKGDKGDTGQRGERGLKGEQGPKGDPGDTGPQGPGLWWRGIWTLGTNYGVGDIIIHDDTLYVVTVAHTASALLEPGVGASWDSVFDEMFEFSLSVPEYFTDMTDTPLNYANAANKLVVVNDDEDALVFVSNRPTWIAPMGGVLTLNGFGDVPSRYVRYIELEENFTLNAGTVSEFDEFDIYIKQGGLGGFTMTFPAGSEFEGGSSTIGLSAGDVTRLRAIYIDGKFRFSVGIYS